MQSDNSHQKLIEGDGSAHLNQELYRSERLSGRDPENKEAQSLLTKDEHSSKGSGEESLKKAVHQGSEQNKGVKRDSAGEGDTPEDDGKRLSVR